MALSVATAKSIDRNMSPKRRAIAEQERRAVFFFTLCSHRPSHSPLCLTFPAHHTLTRFQRTTPPHSHRYPPHRSQFLPNLPRTRVHLRPRYHRNCATAGIPLDRSREHTLCTDDDYITARAFSFAAEPAGRLDMRLRYTSSDSTRACVLLGFFGIHLVTWHTAWQTVTRTSPPMTGVDSVIVRQVVYYIITILFLTIAYRYFFKVSTLNHIYNYTYIYIINILPIHQHLWHYATNCVLYICEPITLTIFVNTAEMQLSVYYMKNTYRLYMIISYNSSI